MIVVKQDVIPTFFDVYRSEKNREEHIGFFRVERNIYFAYRPRHEFPEIFSTETEAVQYLKEGTK